MSSLIFHTEETQVLIAVDTLASDNNGEPAFFTSKAFVLPHLRMIMCGTGLGGFLGQWFIKINDGMVVKGIDNLDMHTTSILQQLWKESFTKLIDPYCGTTTVYHFGFSENTNKIVSYIYRSQKDFTSEKLDEYVLGLKPECNVKPNYELPTDIFTMMSEQREIQLEKPTSERVHIGGEILIYHLVEAGYSIYTLGKFDDYEETKVAIWSNYRKNL